MASLRLAVLFTTCCGMALACVGCKTQDNNKHTAYAQADASGQPAEDPAKDEAVELIYPACVKPGFKTEKTADGLWVLKPGQTKTQQPTILAGQAPDGGTLYAVDRDTALAYLGARPGFDVQVENGRLWVLRPGETPSPQHVTYIAAGPLHATVKANDADTALAWFAAKDGFVTEIEDGRIWVLAPGETKSPQHITRVGAGPRGMTIIGVSKDTLDRYAPGS